MRTRTTIKMIQSRLILYRLALLSRSLDVRDGHATVRTRAFDRREIDAKLLGLRLGCRGRIDLSLLRVCLGSRLSGGRRSHRLSGEVLRLACCQRRLGSGGFLDGSLHLLDGVAFVVRNLG